ncbi:P-II family nitrogen regulator [Opitutus terrae]|uniref:Nitrogen regulatory protein P-II n=1 Tax=Opitutus terrae (strain DSM 11246 / JCM 15787 / PB90-1) TaxID=452637 RepID=B1ZPZ6_OPITP|nr:P-II family nitrogen regulator [Opitutus terrae]ACB77717.1 nitrogen regulatory protein P-II [Opitutus terrae PB90-1]
MKTIISFIRPSKEEAVRDALHNVPDLTGASFSDVRGFGRGGRHGHSPDEEAEALLGTARKVRVEVMVPDDRVEALTRAIAAAAQTGNRGDGKVYVMPLESAVRVSSGETGNAAV